MARYHRCLWYDPGAATPDVPGHPLYVYPRQGAGRFDDPKHEYRMLYAATDKAGCVAEVFGDFAIWTPALLDPPPHLPAAVRAIASYDVDARICDLDDPDQLVELGMRPSQIVSHDRRLTQVLARQVYESRRFDGISWWSRRDARWTSVGLWNHADVSLANVVALDLTSPPVVEAAGVLLRRIGR